MRVGERVRVSYDYFDLMSDEIVLLRNGKVFNVNKAMLQLLGGEANSYIGLPYNNLVITSVDLKDMIMKAEINITNRFSGNIKKINGENIFINFNITAIDDITYMLIVKSKEEKNCIKLSRPYDLKEEVGEDSFVWAILNACDSIYIYDEEEKIIFANNSAAKLVGFSDYKEILEKNIREIVITHPDYKEVISKRRNIALFNNRAFPSLEQRIIRKDGTAVIADISAMSYIRDGIKRVMLIARDITEKKQAVEDRIQLEEALENDKLKTEFFSNISHEFRTPLNIILGTLQLIESMHNGHEKCECFDMLNRYFRMMKQNCYRLLRLVNNLIDITCIDSGFLNVNLINDDIVSVVEDICQSVVGYTETNGMSILFDTDVEERVMAFDPDKIERIMLNLLSNAIKFNKTGGRIEINLYNKPNSIIISVKDNGVGIPEEMRESVFERFIQVDNLFTRGAEGSGIGLSLVKALVEAQGGSIRVESELHRGSNFIIELPITLNQEDNNKNIGCQLNAQEKL
ncbi:MAG: sensor signal transduction histidine kinase, partial [Clostridiales bacterium]|nr:sensor signal transduction histidine kinase [Clostridiales bacterium]